MSYTTELPSQYLLTAPSAVLRWNLRRRRLLDFSCSISGNAVFTPVDSNWCRDPGRRCVGCDIGESAITSGTARFTTQDAL